MCCPGKKTALDAGKKNTETYGAVDTFYVEISNISPKNVLKKFLERKAISRLHRLIPENQFWEESDQCLRQRGDPR